MIIEQGERCDPSCPQGMPALDVTLLQIVRRHRLEPRPAVRCGGRSKQPMPSQNSGDRARCRRVRDAEGVQAVVDLAATPGRVLSAYGHHHGLRRRPGG
jgi:hypothetical protein